MVRARVIRVVGKTASERDKGKPRPGRLKVRSRRRFCPADVSIEKPVEKGLARTQYV